MSWQYEQKENHQKCHCVSWVSPVLCHCECGFLYVEFLSLHVLTCVHVLYCVSCTADLLRRLLCSFCSQLHRSGFGWCYPPLSDLLIAVSYGPANTKEHPGCFLPVPCLLIAIWQLEILCVIRSIPEWYTSKCNQCLCRGSWDM